MQKIRAVEVGKKKRMEKDKRGPGVWTGKIQRTLNGILIFDPPL